MKLLVLAVTLFVAVASVQAGMGHNKDPAWMVFPGHDGKPHLAVLRGNPPQMGKAIDDPYNEVNFYLYTRSNRNTPQHIHVNSLGSNSNFDPSLPVKFLAHGFTADASSGWVIDMKNAYLDDQNCNVVAVDWSGPSQGPLYNVAKANAEPCGNYVAEMQNFLVSQGSSVGRMHCVGHSLGAHVCGFSGKRVSGTLSRITGMDPAMPLFQDDDPVSGRLHSSDANYVQVIHTCGGWLGFALALGHSDYYPNDGTASQPGCGSDITGACSHGRACEFMIESITSNRFVAHSCGSWADFQNGNCNNNPTSNMGESSSTGTRGTYYLATSDRSPFALG